MNIVGTNLDYLPDEEHIVRRLGWAVTKQWHALPEASRDAIVGQAVASYDNGPGPEPVQLPQKIEMFIQKYTKDEDWHLK